jgi:histidine triad (HIT) family protein
MRSLHFGHVPILSPSSAVPAAYYTEAMTPGPTPSPVAGCLFCRIVARQSAADIEYEDDQVLAFKDIYPKAPVHLLIIPKRHIDSIMALAPEDADVIGRCFLAARKLGELTGFADRGYRITVNCGPEGGQHVYHVHFHFMAGRRPPPA